MDFKPRMYEFFGNNSDAAIVYVSVMTTCKGWEGRIGGEWVCLDGGSVPVKVKAVVTRSALTFMVLQIKAKI